MSFCWTRRAIERLVWMSLDGDSSHAIAARLQCHERTVRKMQWELDLASRKDIRGWTPKERGILRRMYRNSRTEAMLAALPGRTRGQIWQQARKLGLYKSIAVIREEAREHALRPDHGSVRSRFPKGHQPANKGLRRPGWGPGRMRETQFKKGNHPWTWKPVGTERYSKEGYLQRKVTDTGYPPRDWVAVHNLMWIEKHGPIPPSHAVAFKDGDKTHIASGNLELISRAELMRRNTIHRYPEQLRNAITLLGALKRKVRERSEKHHDGLTQPSV